MAPLEKILDTRALTYHAISPPGQTLFEPLSYLHILTSTIFFPPTHRSIVRTLSVTPLLNQLWLNKG